MYYQQIIVLICINGLLALGIYWPMSTGLMVACFGSIMSFGAISAAYAHAQIGLPFPLAVLVGGIVGSCFATIVGASCSRLRGFLFTVATLGIGELTKVVATNSERLGGALGYRDVLLVSSIEFLSFLAVVVLIAVAISCAFERTGFSLVTKVIRENELLANSIGVNATRYRVLSMTAGGFLAGLGGAFYIHSIGLLEPKSFGFEHSLLIMMYPLLGGSRRFLGAITGAVVLTAIPEILRFSSTSRMVLYGVVIVAMVVLRPEGLLGSPVQSHAQRTAA